MRTRPEIWAVVLNWNRPLDTIDCVRSLLAQTYPACHILIVDNGSHDDSLALFGQLLPGTPVLSLPANLGFAKAMNLGISEALRLGAQGVLLLNNDTVLHSKALEHMVQAIDDKTGIVAPLILYSQDPDVIWAAGGRLRWRLMDVYGVQRGKPASILAAAPERIECDFVPGAAMLIMRRALCEVGLLDERFFMYYEDLDYCVRLRTAGFSIYLARLALVWHKVAASSGGSDSPSERYWMARSSVQFFKKHVHGGMWPVVAFWRLGSAIKVSCRLLLRGRFAACSSYWRGLWDGLWQETPAVSNTYAPLQSNR